MISDDRDMAVRPTQIVKTAWVPIDLCRLGSRVALNPAAVERAFRRLLSLGDCQVWPPPNGRWEHDRFVVYDGRHEYLAALTLGREHLFVAWLEDIGGSNETTRTDPGPEARTVEHEAEGNAQASWT